MGFVKLSRHFLSCSQCTSSSQHHVIVREALTFLCVADMSSTELVYDTESGEILYLSLSHTSSTLSFTHRTLADVAVITSLSNKVGQLESHITNKVSEIQSFVPTLITETLKEQLSRLLSDALKTTLPNIVKDVIKESVKTSVEENLPVFDEQVQQTLKAQILALFIKPLNKELNAFNKLEANKFIHLQKELSKVMHTLIGKKIADMVSLLKSAEVLKQTNAEGEKCEKKNPEKLEEVNPEQAEEANVQGEQQSENKAENANENQESAAEKVNTEGTMIIHALEEKTSDDEPPTKRLKVLIPTPTPLRTILLELPRVSTPPKDPTPPRVERKGKGIATEEEPLKKILPLIEQGGSDPNMLNLRQFIKRN
ncbi:hypothetical protein Tco_0195915 [Tanacetum coccineum]